MYAEDYHFYKSIHICVGCKKERVFKGETRCPECRAKEAARMQKKRDTFPERYRDISNESKKKSYYKYIEQGICPRCKQNKLKDGRKKCARCLRIEADNKLHRQALKNTDIPRSERPNYGLCYICGQPIVSGHKTCAKHLEMTQKSATLARAAYFEKYSIRK